MSPTVVRFAADDVGSRCCCTESPKLSLVLSVSVFGHSVHNSGMVQLINS